jgi:hypothetical protein
MTGVWPPSRLRPNRLLNEEDLDIRMPPLGEQDLLVQLYFIYIHPTYPIIHKDSFLEEYQEQYVVVLLSRYTFC